jgi:methionine-rich copper-binding protein CopC
MRVRAKTIIAALLLLVSVFAAITARPVQAHGIEVLKTDPQDGALLTAAPEVVRAWFSAELSAEDSYMEVFDTTGKKVDLNNGAVDPDDAEKKSMRVGLPALADGIYVVRWQAMLPDGDSVLGTFQFTVGAVPYPAAEANTAVQSAPGGYPAADPAQDSAGGFIKGIFQNRDSLIGAGIGGLAVLLGLLVLIKKLTGNRD